MPKLTARTVATLTKPGMHGDGGGLYLCVKPTGGKSWVLRTVVHDKRRDFGIGSASLVTLAEAREKASELRKIARDGGDPGTIRKREILTFEQAATRVHAMQAQTFRNEKHKADWLSSLARYAFPSIGARKIETIGTADVLAVLSPVWTAKPETARRVRQRIAAVFDWAKGAGHYPHENPVAGLQKALPKVAKLDNHFEALPWRDLPGFMANLRKREGVSALTLRFLILTAARSGEARGARWSEIDSNVWTIPAARMKAKKPHRIPLSPEALEVLEAVRGLDGDLVFPSQTRSPEGAAKIQSDMVFKALYGRMQVEGFTTHGFRSTFRDWCGESAKADRVVAEAALAHAMGDATERAYARSDLFDRRRALMDAWARYATGTAGAVVELVRA